MKNIKILVILFVFCLIGISCEKILQEDLKAVLSSESYYTDDLSLKSGIMGVYAKLQLIMVDGGRYVTIVGTDIESSLHGSAIPVDTYTTTNNDTRILPYWEDHYVLIQRANVIIDHASKAKEASDAVIKRVVAEARYLRAFGYFNLVRIFGEVPLVVSETLTFDYGLPRSSIKDVYNQILEDLDLSLSEGDLLKVKDNAEPGRVNYWGVKTLKGRVLLTMASYKESGKLKQYDEITETTENLYQQARETLNEVINSKVYSLEPVYGNVFLIEHKNVNPESIWEIQFNATENLGDSWSKNFGISYSGNSPSSPYKTNSMIGYVYYKPTVNFYDFYSKGDARKEWNLPEYTINYTNKVPTSKSPLDISLGKSSDRAVALAAWKKMGTGKYRWGEWNQDLAYYYSNLPNNIIITRYADVLLMYAEASMKANGGQATPESVDAVNEVIQRARGFNNTGVKITAADTPEFPDYTTTTLTFDELFKERARELCFERIRWFDLARTGQLKLVESRIAPTSEATIDESMDYLFPIPAVEIDCSTNPDGFYQNPGYE
jgi:hypothetical protein